MTDFIIHHESSIRLGIFAAILLGMILLECWKPRKKRTQSRSKRWPTNLLLIVIDALFLRLFFPVMAVGVAAWAQSHGMGILNHVNLPPIFEILAAIIILDLLIYWQHVASHHVPLLWALHQVHHADRDLDVTSGSRFHPLEIGFSMGFKILIVALLGAPVLAVIVFEIILNACAMFNHSNVKLPLKLDGVLRKFIVTPDMHRIHHSTMLVETNSNYGFSLSVWDRLFKTYRAQPMHGHDDMVIGLEPYQNDQPNSLYWSLILPFKKKH